MSIVDNKTVDTVVRIMTLCCVTILYFRGKA